jgi:hypothetical protein
MNTSAPQFIGWTAILGGVIGAIGFVSLCLLFVVGEPFGTINDILSVPVAFLMLPLVISLYRVNSVDHSWISLLALLAGVTGFFLTAAGSILLVFGRIDFQQSLLPGIGGFGLIGLWVLLNSLMGLINHTLPKGLAWTGIVLSLTPTLALIAVLRAENIANVLTGMAGQATGSQLSPLVYLFFALGFISYAGLPLWFIWIGRSILSGALGNPVGQVLVRQAI